MKRQRPSALAGAAVLLMTVALAARIAVAHAAKAIIGPQPIRLRVGRSNRRR